MDRRLIGALLMVVVFAAGVVAAKSGGLRTVGQAAMIDFPADPQVGDCLYEPASAESASVAFPGYAAVSGSSTPGSSEPVFGPRFGRCDGRPSAGEVVALLSATGDVTQRSQQIAATGLDCRTASLQYAGLVPVDRRFVPPDGQRDDPVSWDLSINLRSGWMLPTPLLQSVGRTWAACVTSAPNGRLYTGRIASAYNGGTLPDELGTCWDSRSISASVEPVNCGTPHLAELISAGFIPDDSAVTTESVKDSCARLTSKVMDRGDATAAGALTIRISPEVIRPSNEGRRSQTVVCYIVASTAERALAGALVGLGTAPLPYAG